MTIGTGADQAVRKVSTSSAPSAIGPYSQAVIASPYLFISGQLPIDPATGELDNSTITGQTKRIFANLKGILGAAGLDIEDVVKTTVFLTDLADFAEVNDAYAEQFTGDVLPARSTVQVAALPRGANVEVEAIAFRSS
ncbi:Rid family detoxifying hydrolase [Paenarthrobacter sp. NPDC056912]|uniref:Rid family detoxifying hydrolase n=1 Tax=Paenarthrobacter sp. NPDC056912 TaxID=3345965 RepID=UPI0036719543